MSSEAGNRERVKEEKNELNTRGKKTKEEAKKSRQEIKMSKKSFELSKNDGKKEHEEMEGL